MDDEDYRALIDVVTEELRRAGLPDIAHERHYTYSDPDGGEPRLLEPRVRLLSMLEAFERHAAVHDRMEAVRALEVINTITGGEGPRRVVVQLGNDEGVREVDLLEAPDMTSVRDALKTFIAGLRDARRSER